MDNNLTFLLNETNKPNDWPCNAKETLLDNVLTLLNRFIQHPTNASKEQMIRYFTRNSMDSISSMGLLRCSIYEAMVINQIYVNSCTIVFRTGIFFVFQYMRHFVITMRCTRLCLNLFDYPEQLDFDAFLKYLIDPVRYFSYAYNYFRSNGKRSFWGECSEFIKCIGLDDARLDENQKIAGFIGTIDFLMALLINPYSDDMEFSIPNIKDIESVLKEINLIAAKISVNINQIAPIKSKLILLLTQAVFKLRDKNKINILYKCFPIKDVKSIIKTNEVWIHSTDKLNDKREGNIYKEIFNHKDWIKYDWARKVKAGVPFSKRYLCSFSKIVPDSKMKKRYGKEIIGISSDVFAESISPIRMRESLPTFSLVTCYDIIYSPEEAKKEMNILFSFIDILFNNNEDKLLFFDSISPYFIFSYKDKKWSNEEERRFDITLFENHPLCLCRQEDSFLKIESTGYSYPDYVSEDNKMFDILEKHRKEKEQFH